MAQLTETTVERVAAQFSENELLKFGEFTLKSGLKSPFYIDLRKVQSYPETFHAVTDAYIEMLADVESTVLLAGVPEAGTPLASAVGYKSRRSLVQPRKVIKDHGTKSSIEGDFHPGDRVVLLDDLITKGDSKLEAIKQIEKAGLVVEKFIVLVDREQGGLDVVREAGYEIEAAFTITALLNSLQQLGKIDQAKHAEVTDFIKITDTTYGV